MVATSGSGWRLAPSLVAFVKEADRLYPHRDRSSDGSIGDLAHSSRESDHNPYDGWVHAVDLDENLAPGVDLSGLAAHLLTTRDPRVRYVIYEGRIFKSYVDSAGHASWTWMPYTGTNAHTQHLHLSINRTDQARNDLRPWFPSSKPEGVLVALSDAEQAELLERVRAMHVGNWVSASGQGDLTWLDEHVQRVVAAALGSTPPGGLSAEQVRAAVADVLKKGVG